MQTINCRNCDKISIVKNNVKFCSPECHLSWFLFRNLIVNSDKHKQWRKEVIEKHKNACSICGETQGYLHVHHIKQLMTLMKEIRAIFPSNPDLDVINSYAPLWDINNGALLCVSCHCNIGHKKD